MALSLYSINTSERIRARKSAIPSILELQAMDVAFWRDDFMGGAGPTSWYTSLMYQSTASGAAAAAAAPSAGLVGGKLLLDAGTDNAGRSDLSLGLHFRGDLNAHCWFRLQVNAITSYKFEAGLTDVVSGTDAGAVNVKGDNSWNATNAVVLIVDTTNAATLSLMGVKAGTGDTAINFNTTLAAATDYYFGIELREDQARGYLLDANGRYLESTAWMDDAVTATTLLTPWAFVQNRSTANRTLTIDSMLAYCRRTTT